MARRAEIVSVCDSSLKPEELYKLVRRVTSSRPFSSSPTLRKFLLYIAERAIEGKLEDIKEQQIGTQVLGRKPDYDPAGDNIVRVRARQLRQRLDEYFCGEGDQEPVVISIPKGGYVPLFRPRTTNEIKPPMDVPVPASPPHPIRAPNFLRSAALWSIAGLIALAVCLQLWFRREARLTPAIEQTTADATRSLWSPFFAAKGQEVTVVSADAGFALWQDVTDRRLSLGDYVNRRYLQDQPGNAGLLEIVVRRTTSPADLILSLRFSEIARAYGGRVKPQFARNIDIHDLRSGNVVLLGSRRSNPWVELFEPHLNFVLDYDPALKGPCFRNKSPKQGEPGAFSIAGSFAVEGAENQVIQSYAVAALLPSLTGTGRVLVIEGLNMEGTEAAGEFVTNSERFGMLLRRIGTSNNTPVKPFEALLKLTAVAGGYANTELIAYRYPLQ